MSTETQVLASIKLRQVGQSPWLDSISRELLDSGKLKGYVEKMGLCGVTSNPSIFQKAISDGAGYEGDIKDLLEKGVSTLDTYDALTVSDIKRTCDLFSSVFEKSGGSDGFVSLEVLPSLAHNEEETVKEARRLFKLVDKPNVMIKVPATEEGINAIERLIGEGINVNATLMFSLKDYKDVSNAYINGLEVFSKNGGDLKKVHSVASVFVSRIDARVDNLLDENISKVPAASTELNPLKGKAAISNSKIIYAEFKKIFSDNRFKDLEGKGADPQRVLWGSTSTKNPSYPDLLYVEPLVGRNTINTLPLPTWEALLEHGKIRQGTIEEDVDKARDIKEKLKSFAIDVDKICSDLQREGVKSFVDAFDVLIKTLDDRRSILSKKN